VERHPSDATTSAKAVASIAEAAIVIVLDTHAWLWLAAAPTQLSAAAAAAIREARASGGLIIASITLWEFAFLLARGRLQWHAPIDTAFEEVLGGTGVVVRDLTPRIAALAVQLDADFPNDPADRLIAATALAEGLALVTKDARLRASRTVRTVW
jgi:PIN domain nuclease of toxin-antitoxin system